MYLSLLLLHKLFKHLLVWAEITANSFEIQCLRGKVTCEDFGEELGDETNICRAS